MIDIEKENLYLHRDAVIESFAYPQTGTKAEYMKFSGKEE